MQVNITEIVYLNFEVLNHKTKDTVSWKVKEQEPDIKLL